MQNFTRMLLLLAFLAMGAGNAFSQCELVSEGGFEAGSGSAWLEGSNPQVANAIVNDVVPRNGTFSAWLGGYASQQMTSISQDITYPATGYVVLSFWMVVGVCDSPDDVFTVSVDGSTVYSLSCAATGDWVEHTVALGPADGATHTLTFMVQQFATNGTHSNFFLDDISVDGCAEQCPEFTFFTTECVNEEYTVEVDVTDLGEFANVEVTDGFDSEILTAPGLVVMGPYGAGFESQITVFASASCSVTETFFETCIVCDDPSLSGGAPMAEDTVCFFGATSITVEGAVIPEAPTSGFAWVISTEDISNSSSVFGEPSFVGSFAVQPSVPVTGVDDPLQFPNDGQSVPEGEVYYFTPVTFGNGVANTADPVFLSDFDLEDDCTFVGTSIAIAFLAQGDPACTGSEACDGASTPPANDACANAVAVTLGDNGPFENCAATSDAGDEQDPLLDGINCWPDTQDANGNPVGEATNTVWFSYTSPDLVQVVASTTDCSGAVSEERLIADSQIAIYTDCPGAGGTVIACNEDIDGANGNLQAGAAFVAQPGETYYIVVDGWAGERGEFCINITELSCVPPQIEATVLDCVDGEFSVSVDISSLGSFGSFTISDGNINGTIDQPQVFQYGPYPSGSDITIQAITGNVECDYTISGLTQVCPLACDVVTDGSLEAGTPWQQTSTNFGTPLCTAASCGTGGGTGPYEGVQWAWFGGFDGFEEGTISQTVTIPAGLATLEFYLEIPGGAGTGNDFLEVSIDSDVIFSVTDLDQPNYPGYTLVTLDVTSYADDAAHVLQFRSVVNGGGNTNFFVDAIALGACGGGAVCLADAGAIGAPAQSSYCESQVMNVAASGQQTGASYSYIYILTDGAPSYNILAANQTGSFDFSTISFVPGTHVVHGFSFQGTFAEYQALGATTATDLQSLITGGAICGDLLISAGTRTIDLTPCPGIGITKGHAFAINEVMPIPATDVLNLGFDYDKMGEVSLSLYDLSGKLALSQQLSASKGANNVRLDVSGLAAGVYLLSLNDGVAAANIKVVVE